jgi:hypothetical protein
MHGSVHTTEVGPDHGVGQWRYRRNHPWRRPWMFGEWDGFAVAELPDSGTAIALALAVISTGTFAQIATHEVIPIEQINRTLERAKELRARYRPIGAP